jgi:DNA modification methylase
MYTLTLTTANINTRFIEMKISDLRHGDYRGSLDNINGVNLFLTSPPYNIGSKQSKKVGGRKKGGYDAKSWGAIENYPDSMNEDDYQRSQVDFLTWCSERLADDGVIAYNHKARHVNGRMIKPERWLFRVEDESDLVIRDEVVWDRGSTHNHTKAYVYQQTERLWILCKKGARPYFKNQPFFWDMKNKGVGDVWRVPPDYGNSHNAPFPEKLARQIVRMWSPPGGLVCDPYSGSGTTMVSSFIEGRSFVGSEMMENYYNNSLSRLEEVVEYVKTA